DDEREELAAGEEKVDVLSLRLVGRGRAEHLPEHGNLLGEDRDVRQVPARERLPVVMEADPAESACGSLREQEVVVRRVVPARNLGKLLRREEEARHE